MRSSSSKYPARAAALAVACLMVAGLAACSSTTDVSAAPEDETATQSGPATADAGQMRVTLMGTGSPVLNSTRMGPSTLVQAGGLNLLFDAGRGVALRLQQAGVELGSIDGVFLTHFHSDHINGLPDLWLSGFIPSFGGRDGPLNLYGPEGTAHIADGLMNTFDNDLDSRSADPRMGPENTRVVGTDFAPEQIVFDRDGVQVTMFTVQHGTTNRIEPAVGYRVDYEGHSVLISGDTTPVDSILEYGADTDVLVHEVSDFADRDKLANVMALHTSPQEAGTIFSETSPGMAVYSHIVNGIPGLDDGVTEQQLVDRTRETYDGPLTVGADLDSFLITDDGVEVTSIDPDNRYDN